MIDMLCREPSPFVWETWHDSAVPTQWLVQNHAGMLHKAGHGESDQNALRQLLRSL